MAFFYMAEEPSQCRALLIAIIWKWGRRLFLSPAGRSCGRCPSGSPDKEAAAQGGESILEGDTGATFDATGVRKGELETIALLQIEPRTPLGR